MSKGISPLIAAVLLIAFTMAVAGLAGPFLTEVTQKAQGDTVNKSQTIVDSTDARLEVISTNYNSSNSSYSVTIRNAGTDSVQDLTATIYGDSPKQKKINKKLEAGEVHTFDIEEAGNSTKIEVEARDLPVKTDTDLSKEDGSSSGSTASTKTHSISLTSGNYNGTTSYKPDSQDKLSIGYQNGSSGDNLAGYWRLDKDISGSGGTVIDYSGNGNDGTAKNGVTTGKRGTFNSSSFQFDGSNDWVKVSDDSSLQFENVTVSFWTKFDSSSNSDVYLAEKRDGDDFSGWAMEYGTRSSGVTSFYVEVEDGSKTYAGSSTDIGDDNWHHVVGTYDSNTIKIYIDGVEEDSVSLEGNQSDPGALSIGKQYNDGSNDQRHLKGKIDDFRVYNESISSSEIRKLYKFGKPYHGEFNSSKIDKSSSNDWTKLEVNVSKLPSDTDVSANFSALDSSGSLLEDQIISLSSGKNNYSLSVQDSEDARVGFNGTTSNVTKSWEIAETNVYYK